MDAVPILERRNLLRQAALARRNSLPEEDASCWSEQIQARALALDCYRTAAAVAIYSPIQNEVDTCSLLDHALASEKRVFLPRGSGQGFTFARISARSDLARGRLGILEPIGAIGLTDADRQELVVFVPGVVFDARGNRLGRGAGFYDRMLGQLVGSATIVGLAYEFQIVDAVPSQSWDCRMEFVVTEARTIDCGVNLHKVSVSSMGN
jgi:5-formyltetrahydrofolate cyclo-ligase